MYCRKCGKQVMKSSNFCSACGTAVSSGPTAKRSSRQTLVLKPKFLPIVTFFSVLPLQIFFTIWGALFFGGFGMFALQAFHLNLPTWFTFVFFGCAFFFAIPILAYVAKKNTYAKTEYRFCPTKLEYYEGFFSVEEKAINYSNITEVYLRKGIFQKKYGLGTIVLSTPAMGFSNGRARSGIMVADIENPDNVYQQVKELVGCAA